MGVGPGIVKEQPGRMQIRKRRHTPMITQGYDNSPAGLPEPGHARKQDNGTREQASSRQPATSQTSD